MPHARGFRHVCNKQCHLEHTKHFNATHSCKKHLVKNVVQRGFQVANKVQDNLSASNILHKVISFIPECVNKISTTLNKKISVQGGTGDYPILGLMKVKILPPPKVTISCATHQDQWQVDVSSVMYLCRE